MENEYLRQMVDHLKKIEKDTAQTRWWVVFFGRIKVFLVVIAVFGWLLTMFGIIVLSGLF